MTIPDWFNSTFILSLVALLGSGATVILTYFLKSRCSTIKLCCGMIECNRQVIELDASQVQLENNNNNV